MIAAWILVAIPVLLFVYAYFVYPSLLAVLAPRETRALSGGEGEWPELTITLPAYNEEASIATTIDRLLGLDYPADRRHILVVSDASTDRTDEIVKTYADRGVSLLRLARRGGKTAAENAAEPHLRGELVVNTDATTRLAPQSLKALVRAFQDPTVGAASGRDVSVGTVESSETRGEHGYVGYEMWVRGLETRLGSIVGVSGCFYAIRRSLYDPSFPATLSRDFGTALWVTQRGFRAISVPDAICMVPRALSLRSEYRRKIRTMHRGLETLWNFRALMNPFRHGRFALMLISHKLCRWLVPLTAPAAAIGVAMLAMNSFAAALVLAAGVVGLALGGVAFAWPRDRQLPSALALPGFLVASMLAGFLAWTEVFTHTGEAIWEPTRRAA
jgi:cellulose synthase/poly-beta-1,6-N-acetylglucosamine synthase-like glycosyltransferase